MGKKLTRGDRAIEWIETHCRIPEGKFIGQPVKLRPWQRRLIKKIYDSPTRTAIISFGRKNGKTALAAFLLLLHLCGYEAIANSQLYSAAQSKDQAALLFGLASKMVRLSPTLDPFILIRDQKKEIFCPRLGTLYCALSAEVKTKFGMSPAFIVHDELGQVRGPRSELYEALETAVGAQENPLSVIISTQAPTDADLLSVLIDDAKSGADKNVKLFLYTADETLDPFGIQAMRAANPALGDFLNLKTVKTLAADAKRMPSRESGYRNLILNQRVNQTSPYVSRRIWAACAGELPKKTFAGKVYVGLDLSARGDLTARVAICEAPDGVWDVMARFYAPTLGLIDRSKRDRAPYDLWAKQGFITLTPGASVDYDFVAEDLCRFCDDYDVRGIAFDRWRMDVLKAALIRHERELPLVEHGQGFKDMTPALEALTAELLNTRLRTGANPVLTWCAANAVATTDPAGNQKLDKSKATGRIDGMVALAMAFGIVAKPAVDQKIVTVGSDYEVTAV